MSKRDRDNRKPTYEELQNQLNEALKELVKPQAIEYVKHGVPLDRFNEVVMELSRTRDENVKLRNLARRLAGYLRNACKAMKEDNCSTHDDCLECRFGSCKAKRWLKFMRNHCGITRTKTSSPTKGKATKR